MLDAGAALNIAHAGGDQAWPHSTFYAFDHAVDAGADVLEMDVQLTGDGVLIVQHDDTVDGTTNGTGRADSFTFDEIVQLGAAYWYSPGCWPCRDLPDDDYVLRGVRTGEVPAPDGVDPDTLRIVSFAELVERYPDMPFDIEIKGSAEAAAATADVGRGDRGVRSHRPRRRRVVRRPHRRVLPVDRPTSPCRPAWGRCRRGCSRAPYWPRRLASSRCRRCTATSR
ncbi:MAG: glycerophosphodiester phosphodiesterase family protein [Ilumatobacteraceae bacterium]